MTKEDYEKYKNTSAKSTVSMADMSDPSAAKTLLYGYTLDRYSFHVYTLGDGHIYLYIYKYEGKTFHYRKAKSFDMRDLVPCKRTYPSATDFEFASFFKKNGIDISFTSLDDREQVDFYGEIYEEN